MSAQPRPRLINARDCLARFAPGRKFALNYKINQQQCDFLMLYCCLPTHTHTRTHTQQQTNIAAHEHLCKWEKGKTVYWSMGARKLALLIFWTNWCCVWQLKLATKTTPNK